MRESLKSVLRNGQANLQRESTDRLITKRRYYFQGVQPITSKLATIPASEVRMMKSKHTGRKYRISISLPFASLKSDLKMWPFNEPLQRWPVVYLIDGNWFFGMVTAIVRNMGWFGKWSGNATDAIVVGIGYPENQNPQEALCDQMARRFHDLTPIRDEGVEKWVENLVMRSSLTGGAGAFLHSIKEELIPVIEQDFQADPHKRILAGQIEDTAMQSASAGWTGAAARATCAQCGTKLQKKGKKKRRLQTQEGETIELEREYGVCPQCGQGLFPPR